MQEREHAKFRGISFHALAIYAKKVKGLRVTVGDVKALKDAWLKNYPLVKR